MSVATAAARACSSLNTPIDTVCASDSRASVWLRSDSTISWNSTTAIVIIGTTTITTKNNRRRALKVGVRS